MANPNTRFQLFEWALERTETKTGCSVDNQKLIDNRQCIRHPMVMIPDANAAPFSLQTMRL